MFFPPPFFLFLFFPPFLYIFLFFFFLSACLPFFALLSFFFSRCLFLSFLFALSFSFLFLSLPSSFLPLFVFSPLPPLCLGPFPPPPLAGPVVGSALLLGVGPAYGMFINVLFYLPLTVFLWFVRFDGPGATKKKTSIGQEAQEEVLVTAEPETIVETAGVIKEPMTFLSAFRVLGTIKRDRQLLGMILLSALSAATIGAVMQNAMPEFAEDLGAGSAGLAYGVLLLANGAGGVIGGFLLEATGKVPSTARTAVVGATTLGLSTVAFASTSMYPVAVIALLIGGLAKITADSTQMSIVQLRAPDDQRGRVIGAYTMFGPGMMTFSGITVAVLGSLFGLRGSVLFGGIVLTLGAIVVGIFVLRSRPAPLADGNSR